MVTIRPGNKSDLPHVLALIKELAAYEKAADEVENTLEMMEADGFGENPIYGLFVAENSERIIIGIAIYYYRYSTWKGKRMYLEDIVVTASERGKGVGKKLFDATIKEGVTADCTGMMWQVLDWNESAIRFYKKKYNCTFDDDWINCSLTKQQMEQALAR